MHLKELASHPHVLEVSVVARSHPKWGERPMAFVILHNAHKDKWHDKHDDFEKELKRYAKTRLPGFACPEWVAVVDELPVGVVIVQETQAELTSVINRKRQPVRFSRPICAEQQQNFKRSCDV